MATASFDKPLLLTGASGVVGSELLRWLPSDQLLLGRHRARPNSQSRQIAIDIRRPNLGLNPGDYKDLASSISGIVHCAAITDMNGVADGLFETNIDGAKHMVALANDSDVPLHFVSTAYCSERFGPKAPVDSAYVRSKRAAEEVVRASGLDWTILRPSIVVGHSQTGQIASFQGFHLFVASILKGRLPFIPLERSARCDFIPVDYVAAAIAAILKAPDFDRTYWLTGGDSAITVQHMLDYGQPFARELGRDLTALQIEAPENIQRDVLPALKARGSKRLMERVGVLMELASVMATVRPFPSDMPDLLPASMPLSRSALERVLGHNLIYWGKENRKPFQTTV